MRFSNGYLERTGLYYEWVVIKVEIAGYHANETKNAAADGPTFRARERSEGRPTPGRTITPHSPAVWRAVRPTLRARNRRVIVAAIIQHLPKLRPAAGS